MEQRSTVDIIIRGRVDSRLVIHRFAEKAKQEIRDKQQKKAKKAKEERKPREEFLAARYVDARGRECLPLMALKEACVSAARGMDNIKMVGVRQALFLIAPDADPADPCLCPILDGDGKPAVGVMREDAVTIGMNTRGLTYRPDYPRWQARIRIEFNSRMLSEEQVLALVDEAGWGVGICEGRPEKSSLGWGRFERVEAQG